LILLLLAYPTYPVVHLIRIFQCTSHRTAHSFMGWKNFLLLLGWIEVAVVLLVVRVLRSLIVTAFCGFLSAILFNAFTAHNTASMIMPILILLYRESTLDEIFAILRLTS